MPFTAQLQLLTQAVEKYCRDCGITAIDERLYVAEMASALFDLGAFSMHDLLRGLDDVVGPRSRPGHRWQCHPPNAKKPPSPFGPGGDWKK